MLPDCPFGIQSSKAPGVYSESLLRPSWLLRPFPEKPREVLSLRKVPESNAAAALLSKISILPQGQMRHMRGLLVNQPSVFNWHKQQLEGWWFGCSVVQGERTNPFLSVPQSQSGGGGIVSWLLFITEKKSRDPIVGFQHVLKVTSSLALRQHKSQEGWLHR